MFLPSEKPATVITEKPAIITALSREGGVAVQ
jgi:hypothetical protein